MGVATVQRLAAGGKPDSAVLPEQSSNNFSGQRMPLHLRFHRHDNGHSGRGFSSSTHCGDVDHRIEAGQRLYPGVKACVFTNTPEAR